MRPGGGGGRGGGGGGRVGCRLFAVVLLVMFQGERSLDVQIQIARSTDRIGAGRIQFLKQVSRD